MSKSRPPEQNVQCVCGAHAHYMPDRDGDDIDCWYCGRPLTLSQNPRFQESEYSRQLDRLVAEARYAEAEEEG